MADYNISNDGGDFCRFSYSTSSTSQHLHRSSKYMTELGKLGSPDYKAMCPLATPDEVWQILICRSEESHYPKINSDDWGAIIEQLASLSWLGNGEWVGCRTILPKVKKKFIQMGAVDGFNEGILVEAINDSPDYCNIVVPKGTPDNQNHVYVGFPVLNFLVDHTKNSPTAGVFLFPVLISDGFDVVFLPKDKNNLFVSTNHYRPDHTDFHLSNWQNEGLTRMVEKLVSI